MLEVIQPISCDNCSACCMHLGVPPFDQDDGDFEGIDAEWEAMPQSLKDEVDAAWERGVSSFVGQPCIWLDVTAKRCRNYEHRPGTCRRFEPGNPFCLEDRAGENV